MKKIIVIFLIFILGCIAVNAQPGKRTTEGVPYGDPKNIIVIFNHGMSTSYLASALMKNKDTLGLASFPVTGLMKSWTKQNVYADAYGKMSVLATGTSGPIGSLGVDKNGAPVKNLFEIAKVHFFYTGLVTTTAVTKAPSLAFLIHTAKYNGDEATALDISKSNFEVLLGGGKKYFTNRADKKNLYADLFEKKYDLPENLKDLQQQRTFKLLGLMAEDQLSQETLFKDEFLYKTSDNLAKYLGTAGKSYFLVLENAKILNGPAWSSAEQMAEDAVRIDKMIANLRKLCMNETLILVIGDTDAGELQVSGGDPLKGKVSASLDTKAETINLVPVFAYGPGSERFSGIFGPADVFRILNSIISVRYK